MTSLSNAAPARPAGSWWCTRHPDPWASAREVAARIMELAFDHLQAPVARVTGWDTPYPPASLEQLYLPSIERICDAARKVVAY